MTPWRLAALLLLTSLLCGCSSTADDPVPTPTDVVTDEELKEADEWTEDDALARRLLGGERGNTQEQRYRPVRRPEFWKKLRDPREAVLFGFGMSYDKPYTYVSKEKAYVFHSRGAPPVVVTEEFGGELEPDEPGDPDPEALREWQRDTAEEAAALNEATQPKPIPFED